jgi:nucleotide sugar dehydrogenase
MDKPETITVIGTGKLGLPLACTLARAGASVMVCDPNQAVVKTINQGRCPFPEPSLERLLKDVVKRGRLTATSETTKAVASSDVVVVIVPVQVTDSSEANLASIQSASSDIAKGLKRGMMVCYETTSPVGTTRSMIPILETSGLKAGRDFDLVFSPERSQNQKVLEKLDQIPKVVGGINSKSANRAVNFYQRYLRAPAINVHTLEAAELVKLAGMVYRDVNIALANELARYASQVGVDIKDVISAANTDGDSRILTPGVGVGGHSTPIYPNFLIKDAEKRGMTPTLATESRSINDAQPSYAVQEIEQRFGRLQGRDVLILGLAFRPHVKEYMKSPAFGLREALRRAGANVLLNDPLYSNKEIMDAGFRAFDLHEREYPEVVILNTAHNEFLELDFKTMHRKGCRVIFDGRNAWDPLAAEEAQLLYLGIGKSGGLDEDEGEDQMKARIAVAKPLLGTPEVKAVTSVVRSGSLSMGEQVRLFEQEFAQFTKAPYATAVSSGATALHLALLSVGVRPSDEVVTVSHTRTATAQSIRYCGAVPVFVDIDKLTFNIDASLIENAINEKTRAILVPHLFGMPCEMHAILDIAAKHRLPVVEDAAMAVGSEILINQRWERIGSPHGDVACFSFDAHSLLTTGEGGMIVTKDEAKDRLFKTLRNEGIESGQHKLLGFNYRMTDMQAAVGRQQLERLPGIIEQRHRQAQLYRQELAAVSVLKLPVEPEWARTNWQSFCVKVENKRLKERLMKELQSKEIDTICGVTCVHREEAFKHEDWHFSGAATARAALKASEESQDCCVILPMHHSMRDEQFARIARAIKDMPVKVKA